MAKDEKKLEAIRHSLSHVMMQALEKLYQAVPGVGPSIENGFYHDFDAGHQVSLDDLSKIEEEMRKIIKEDLEIKKSEMPVAKGIEFLEKKKYIYTAELARDLKGEAASSAAKGEFKISFFEQDGFINMCKGPHVASTGIINPEGFKLTKIAGAYWKGSEKNKMIQRIYGVAFLTKKDLEEYLKRMEEAEKRDHRKIGKELDLFSFHDVAPGMPFFHPKGAIIYNELKNFWIESQKEFDYDTVLCPSMLDVSVWKQSGHWDHYKDDMYFIDAEEDEKKFALRPMDCPGAILIYNNSLKSYRDLPLRYAEPGLITRKEKTGQLGGLLRVQQFTQDDAHIFIREDQIEDEIKKVIQLIDKMYKPFGLEYKAYLSTRPDDFMGDAKVWAKAEKDLMAILKDLYGDEYGMKEKDGAFYGPKIDFQLKDAIGRTWQCATVQLDFQMPLKFDCHYIDKDGKEKSPVLIHRTILGSFERFMGILIEHYAGVFPVWLSPVQVKILSVAEKHAKFSEDLAKKLVIAGIRAEADVSDETLGNKIRKASGEKIPYVIVIGDKEMAGGQLAVRLRGQKELKLMAKDELVGEVKERIEKRASN